MAKFREITKEELKEVLRKHKLWLGGKKGGKRADLSKVDLSGADLSGADLRWAKLRGADLSNADLRWADLSEADLSKADLSKADLSEADLIEAVLSKADLSEADLRWAKLSGADLSGAVLDFSCVPLWCGSLKAHFDDRQIIQIVYHAVKAGTQSKNVSEEVKKELYKLTELANSFHRIEECGRIYNPEEEKEGEEE